MERGTCSHLESGIFADLDVRRNLFSPGWKEKHVLTWIERGTCSHLDGKRIILIFMERGTCFYMIGHRKMFSPGFKK